MEMLAFVDDIGVTEEFNVGHKLINVKSISDWIQIILARFEDNYKYVIKISWHTIIFKEVQNRQQSNVESAPNRSITAPHEIFNFLMIHKG